MNISFLVNVSECKALSHASRDRIIYLVGDRLVRASVLPVCDNGEYLEKISHGRLPVERHFQSC